MSLRLHPLTNDSAILEKLAGVPHGTAAEYTQLESKYHGISPAAFYIAACGFPLVSRYCDFLLFGWGRLTPRAWQYIHSTNCTQFRGDDAQHILSLLGVTLPHGVSVEDIGGVAVIEK